MRFDRLAMVVASTAVLAATAPALGETSFTQITWYQSGESLVSETDVGKTLSFQCSWPINHRPVNRAYGGASGTYSVRSGLCSAAAHAGVIPYSSSGRFSIVVKQQGKNYTGSFRNEVTSLDDKGPRLGFVVKP